MKIYRIQLLHQQRHIQHNNQLSLLSALEQQGIFPEYQCRAGHCGSCRVKIRKGKVSYKEAPLAFLNPDEILLCCCQVEEDLELEL